MKYFSLFFALLLFACDGNNTSPEAVTSTNTNSESANAEKTTKTNAEQGNGKIGEWQLKYIAIDQNRNKKIDEDEIKNAITQANDYFRFNADGSCLYTQIKLNGRYEVKDKDGKSKLYIYAGNEEVNKYDILSVNTNELQLLHYHGENSFHVFKRL
jgi:hypothetical protein